MNTSPVKESLPELPHNPWRESLENCMTGDNYLRTSEWQQLIELTDDFYALQAIAAPREGLTEDQIADAYAEYLAHDETRLTGPRAFASITRHIEAAHGIPAAPLAVEATEK